jgi:hypothetical protein
MHSYLAFFKNSSAIYHNYKEISINPNINDRYVPATFGCRETLINSIEAYSEKFIDESDDILYFGHRCYMNNAQVIQEALTNNCLNICKDLWKDTTINCELIQLKDVKNDLVKARISEKELNNTVVAVDKKVNPFDLSLILWLAWYGFASLRSHNRNYYIIKKFSDLIPDLYVKGMSQARPYSWSNGPVSLMQQTLESYWRASNYPEIQKFKERALEILADNKGKRISKSSLVVNIRELSRSLMCKNVINSSGLVQ